jgi:zinc finger CCCH domain-containing protein 11
VLLFLLALLVYPCWLSHCLLLLQPLESLNQTKSFANPLSSHGSTCFKPANLCYFYYNSYCAKGDRCPFLHKPLTCNNAVETCSEATTLNPIVIGNAAGAEMILSLNNSLANPAEDISNHIKEHHSKRVTESSDPEIDGSIPSASETSADTGAHMKSSAHSNQSSEHSKMEHAEQDEQCDSSPSFDVLVDDRDSNKNDFGHQLAAERDANGPYVEYDGGDSVGYGLDCLDSECYEHEFFGFDSACYQVDSFYLDRLKEHDTVSTLGHIPHNRIKLEKSTFDEYGRRFMDPKNFISSMADADVDHQYTEIGHSSKRGPENRKGVKGRKSHIKRCRGFEPTIGSEEIESRSIRRRQYSLMGECSRPAVCATFREQKRSRRKQHRRHHAKSAERNANEKHQDYTKDFTGPKTLAQIKEEKYRSKSSSQPNVYMPHGRPFSNDFEGPKSLSELLKAKGLTYGGSQCRIPGE